MYDTEVEGGSRFRQADREKSLQALMTTNLLKRLESSVESFRITLRKLKKNHHATLEIIDKYNRSGENVSFNEPGGDIDTSESDDDAFDADETTIGGKIK